MKINEWENATYWLNYENPVVVIAVVNKDGSSPALQSNISVCVCVFVCMYVCVYVCVCVDDDWCFTATFVHKVG